MTEHMFAEVKMISSLDNMPASEWAPIGNAYTISSAQLNKWSKKNDEKDDKSKPLTISNMFRKTKTMKLALNKY